MEEGRMDIRSATARQGPALRRLHALAASPPQSLLLEGGTDEERKGVARYWAALLNCDVSRRDGPAPCLECAFCKQVADNAYKDLLLMDEAYYEDGKSRLSVKAVKDVMPSWGTPPTGRYRVTIFPDIRDLSEVISNTLLKSLEEPRPGNVFVLLSPQRERVLPTLVSRSWVLTLAWPEAAEAREEAVQLASAMVGYWGCGRGWFEHTQAKVAAPVALDMVNHLMGALRDAMAGRAGAKTAAELARIFDAKGLRKVDLALAKAQEALSLTPSPVNPALVLDWVASAVRHS